MEGSFLSYPPKTRLFQFQKGCWKSFRLHTHNILCVIVFYLDDSTTIIKLYFPSTGRCTLVIDQMAVAYRGKTYELSSIQALHPVLIQHFHLYRRRIIFFCYFFQHQLGWCFPFFYLVPK